MSIALDPKKNHLLAALPEAEWQRWRPQLEPVEMPLGEVLSESDRILDHVYFPLTAIVSLLNECADHGGADAQKTRSLLARDAV
ncbi:hypothetical protein [Thiocystis minor]|uniref:hypothetical protein n=1 Tax=Thiocystis minor TaxID=61597 RepID=UPI001F5DBFE0|nr:hypothetical protein [Thiocystis minor]